MRVIALYVSICPVKGHYGTLPGGYIVGLILFSKVRPYDEKKDSENKYAQGPFIYEIEDVVRFSKYIKSTGKLGFFKLSKEIVDDFINQEEVIQKIRIWKGKYNLFPNCVDGDFRALAIKEPWCSLILNGEKRVENRSRKIGCV